MKKRDENSLGEALHQFLKQTGMEEKVLETEIYGRWEELAGKSINLKTKKLRLKKGVLTVYLSSSVMRNELMMRRSELLENINQRLASRVRLRALEFR